MRKIKIIGHGKKAYLKEKGKKYEVKRKWWSKKKGKYIEKKYTYDYKGYKTTTRSSKLLVKNGKLTDYGKEVREAMVTKLGKPFEAKVDELLHKVVNKDKSLKESTFMSQIENALEQAESKSLNKDNSRAKLRTFIYNMGGDVEDLASDLGITKKELLDEKNWRFVNSEEAYFTFGGYEYSFYFKYEENEIRWQRSKLA